MKEDGTLWTWGSNECGGLGDGGMHASHTCPFQIGKSEFKGKRILAITAWKNESYALTEDDTLWYWGHDNNGKPYCLDTPVIVPEAVGKTTPQKIKKLFYTTESDMYGLYGLGTDNTLYKLEPGYTASTSQKTESEKVRLEKIAGNVSQFIISRGELAIEKTDGTVWIKNDNPYDNERFFQILFVRPPENGSPAK